MNQVKKTFYITIGLIGFAFSLVFYNSVFYKMIRYGNSGIHDFRLFESHKILQSEKTIQVRMDNFVDKENLQKFKNSNQLEFTISQNNTLAFLIIHNDTVLLERYYNGCDRNSTIQYFSMTKSVMSLLIGCAIDDKLIGSENDYVTNYIPEFKNKGFKNITVSDLLQMQAPLNYEENDNPFGEHARFYYTSKLEEEILKLTVDENGKHEFVYRSGNSAILGLILKRVLKSESISHYLQRKIWIPLGMENSAYWIVDSKEKGLEKTWCCLAGTARDFARIANLVVHAGKCGQKQIISENWINKTLAPLSVRDNVVKYNYNWWIYSKAIIAIGKDGQFTFIYPSKKLIIVRLGEGIGKIKRDDWILLFDKIANNF